MALLTPLDEDGTHLLLKEIEIGLDGPKRSEPCEHHENRSGG
jgi:hypothetical protein